MNTRILIVGQGLAGTVLSFLLDEAGFDYQVIDQAGLTQSSRVAAGLYNPVTGRKMVLSWKAAQLFPLLQEVYGRMEARLQQNILHDLPIYRPFIDQAEQNDWAARQGDAAYAPFIVSVEARPQYPGWVNNPYGGLRLKQCGWLDINTLLDGWRTELKHKHRLHEQAFQEEKLVVREDSVAYGGLEFDKVVYCTGTAISRSAYWNWLPMRPVKGEVLDLKADIQIPEVINRGVFFIPLPEGNFRAGSTYHQQQLNFLPSEEGKTEILEKLRGLLSIPLEVCDHKTGIRPATKDRRPLVGSHPVHKTLAVLNGLGTKGVSLAPYCAVHLLDWLKSGEKPDPALDIERFFSLY